MSKTNKERLQDNNLELQNIKTGIDSLPEYQDITPIYDKSDYHINNTNLVANGTYGMSGVQHLGKYFMARRVVGMYDNFLRLGYIDESGASIILYTIFNNNNNQGSMFASIIDYDDNFVYYVYTTSQSSNSVDLYKVSITDKTSIKVGNISDLSYFTNGNCFVPQRGQLAVSNAGNSIVVYEVNVNNLSKNQLYTVGNKISINIQTDIMTNLDYSQCYNTRTNTLFSISNLRFISPKQDVCVSGGKFYRLVDGSYRGEYIKDLEETDNYYIQLGGNYYIKHNNRFDTNNGFNSGSLVLYDEENITFTELANLKNIHLQKNYTWGNYYSNYISFETVNNSTSCFTSFDTDISKIIGYNIDGNIVYLKSPVIVSSNKILNGVNTWLQDGSSLIGTMPNNGALNYIPTTSQQTIPEGYTSGGTISAVTSAIDQNIQANNIKKDVEILGVTGTYEGSGGSSGDVKLFDTVEHMQEDTDAQEGDLAIVYGKGYTPLTENSITRYVRFPETITFPSPLSPEAGYFTMGPVDSSITDRQLSIDIGTNYFMVEFMSNENGFWMFDYTTDDNIHYTCSRVLSNPYDLSCPFQFEGEWNDLFSYILDVQTDMFTGVYKYEAIPNPNSVYLPDFSEMCTQSAGRRIHYDTVVISEDTVDSNYLDEVLSIINFSSKNMDYANIVFDGIYYYVLPSTRNVSNINLVWNYGTDKLCVCADAYFTDVSYYESPAYIYKIDKSNGTYITIDITNLSSNTLIEKFSNTSQNRYLLSEVLSANLSKSFCIVYNTTKSGSTNIKTDIALHSVASAGADYNYSNVLWGNQSPWKTYNVDMVIWKLADTQLDVTDEYVYKKNYYGKNGASIGTIAETISNEFNDVSANLYIDLLKSYSDMEPIVLQDGDKISANYRAIPTRLDGTPLLDTGNLTSFSRVFEPAVYNLRVIPALNISGTNDLNMMFFPLRMLTDVAMADTSHIQSMSSMFYSCYSLTNIPNMNTQNVTSMRAMFMNCAAMLDVPNFNTVNVTYMDSMFYSCYAVKNIPNFNMSNVTHINSMMSSCTKLENAPMIDAPKVTNAYGVFWGCYQLKNVPCFNLPNATNMTNMFAYCNNLTDVSLNNILGMCAKSLNATNKKLGNLGLNQNLLNRCVNLSNYQNAVTAGWSV